MKCEYCYGTLSLEDEYCPHCGQPNKHAKQHIRDMKRYQGEFEDTRSYVYQKTGQYTGLAVRAAIIAALVILNVVVLVLGNNAWSIHSRMVRAKSERNYTAYSQMMDNYLEEENYLEFYSFCAANKILYYNSRYSEKYELLEHLCGRYYFAYESLQSYLNYQQEPIDGQLLVERLTDDLGSLYQYIRNEDGEYTKLYGESAAYSQAAEVMAYNVKQMLVTYGGFTEEEAESLSSMKKTKMALLLEEKLEERMENGDKVESE